MNHPGFVWLRLLLWLIVIRFGSIMANRRCISRNLSRQHQNAVSGDFYDITQLWFIERASYKLQLKAELFIRLTAFVLDNVTLTPIAAA